jgi:uncharacterized membrane protein YraQ (UPF0718 family)
MMDFILKLLGESVSKVFVSVTHNWPFLLASIVIAALLQQYVDAGKVAGLLRRFRRAGVAVATTAAVATPLCSCGTTAVVLGMMASTMPWAPIVAFMVASPLSSPEGFVYTAGLFGWPFAIGIMGSSVLLGLAGGAAASMLESRGWLRNQARMAPRVALREPEPAGTCGCSRPVREAAAEAAPAEASVAACACAAPVAAPIASPACACSVPAPKPKRFPVMELLKALCDIAKRLVPMFLGFAFIGYFLNGLIPASWVSAIFGGGNVYSVPLAATLGLPLYINSEASLPLVRSLLDAGMSHGAAMAFLITGAGTSIGAIVGALTIARWRVVALVVAVLWIGAMAAGYAFDSLHAAGLF